MTTERVSAVTGSLVRVDAAGVKVFSDLVCGVRLIRVVVVTVEGRTGAVVTPGVIVVEYFWGRTVVLRDFDAEVPAVETRDGAEERDIFAVLTTSTVWVFGRAGTLRVRLARAGAAEPDEEGRADVLDVTAWLRETVRLRAGDGVGCGVERDAREALEVSLDGAEAGLEAVAADREVRAGVDERLEAAGRDCCRDDELELREPDARCGGEDSRRLDVFDA